MFPGNWSHELRTAFRKQAVDDLIGSPIATDRQKLPKSARIGLARNASASPAAASLRRLDRDSRNPQAIKRCTHALAAAPAARRRINDG